uniref:Uncharacterized protein n=1 Tax=Anguilla anguilla TaxID=7936 RepID=A0A0E9U656_ANGAN
MNNNNNSNVMLL